MNGPHNVIVAENKRAAENWARLDYRQQRPHAVEVGTARDGINKTFKVYDLDDERVTS